MTDQITRDTWFSLGYSADESEELFRLTKRPVTISEVVDTKFVLDEFHKRKHKKPILNNTRYCHTS